MTARTLACGVVSALAVFAAGAEEPLRFNPFASPDLSGLESGPGPDGAAPVGSWEPVLRATLVAADGSLADLGGVLLEVGETHRGWRLLEVHDFDAVFERNGEQVLLPVSPGSAAGGPR